MYVEFLAKHRSKVTIVSVFIVLIEVIVLVFIDSIITFMLFCTWEECQYDSGKLIFLGVQL